MYKNMHISSISILLLIFISTASWADTFPNAALGAADEFVAALDIENYEQAYHDAAPLLQALKSKENWIQEIKPVKDTMGSVLSRSLKAIKKTAAYSGLPDGDYVQVYYETEMAHKKKAAEVVLTCQTDGTWKICSYSLK